MPARVRAGFLAPMLLLRTDALPDDRSRWAYQLKFDGYRAVAFKTGGKLRLRSRNDKDFTTRYPTIVRGLGALPDDTVVDGEVIALDADGRPSFSALQNFSAAPESIVYYLFDVMMLGGKDVTREPWEARRHQLEKKILPTLTEPVRYM